MKILEITQGDAIKAYNNAEQNGKQLLEDLFGADKFNQNITDRIKTFEDACEVLGVAPSDVLPTSKITNSAVTAVAKLFIIAEALNEGWKPDWQDSDQCKYMPWFEDKSGVGLSFYAVDYWTTISRIGSRLCLKSRELAEYAGKQFEDIYKQFLIIQ